MHREGPLYSRLILMDASAKWDSNSPQFTVNHINLGVQQGELLAVAGPEGGGKTSLLHMILGELPPCSGKITVNGNCVYCPQKPWIFPSTLRKNITCGRPYREEHFKKVMAMCDLEEVMSQFAEYDLTDIGEGGCGSYSILKSHGLELHRYVEYDKHGELDQEEEEGKSRNNNVKNTLEVPQPDPAEVYSYCRKGSSEPVRFQELYYLVVVKLGK
ncbi:hypothetical protein C0J52_04615 [Blattella germanica]|nr:hypothetical protein C0J52_04615 [Blattella germanica]